MLGMSLSWRGGSATAILGFALVMIATAWFSPPLLPALIAACLAAGVVALAYRHLILAWELWLLVTGLSLEMAFSDLIGPAAFQPTIAAVKGCEIGLVALTMLRHGVVLDTWNPAWGFLAIAVMGMVAGVHPDLTQSDMLRSLIGSVTPFLLFFCVKPVGWPAAMGRVVAWVPTLSVVLGLLPDLAGLRHAYFESGGFRLAGLGHPAFLAGVCLPAIYAGLMSWLRTGSSRTALLLGANLAILLLTGARAPLAYAAIVVVGSLLFAPGAAVPLAHRLVAVVAGVVAVPAVLLLGETYSSLRLFEVLDAGQGAHMSGRDLLWPMFEAAAARAPWFGWGIGSGNLVIPRDGPLAHLLGTFAAHNEYLRLQVEGGYVGRTLLLVLFVFWTVSHTSRLPRLERLVMRLIFLTYAAHAVTDNVLISTPACVFFTFVASVYAAAEEAARARLRQAPDVA
jgi:hypothetical protein